MKKAKETDRLWDRSIAWWHARFWIAAGAAFAAWLASAVWVMPAAIRSAHAGGGPALLRRVMSEADSRPLDGYLETWQRMSLSSTFLLATGILLSYVGLRLLRAHRQLPLTHGPEALAAEPVAASVPWFAPLVVAVWFGLLGGIGEGYYASAKVHLLAEIIPRFAPTSLELAVWAPFVNAFIMAGLAFPAVFLRHDRARRGALLFVFSAACFGVLLGWIRLPERVSFLPALVLALGMTAQAGRMVRGRLPEFTRYTVRSVRLGLTGLTLLAAAVYGRRLVPDWRSDVMPAASAPNVVLIVLDTERARSMGLYGYDRNTTPRIDDLARRGIVFNEAYAPSAWTLPSHAALFTGHYPVDIPLMTQTPLPAGAATIAESFDAAGYATGGFVGNLFMLSDVFRLNRGFREWRATHVNLESLWATMWNWRTIRQRIRGSTGKHRYIVLKDAAVVNRETLAWIDRVPEGRPFFAFINYFDVHEPYSSADLHDLEGEPRSRTLFLTHGPKADRYSAAEIDRLRAGYDASIRYLDSRVGMLLDDLEARGKLENTIIAITSDHGEQFGEHGLLEHGNSLYRPLIRVPLILILPNGLHAGLRIDRPVGIHRSAATLAELAGVPTTVGGASLLPLIAGTEVEADAVFSFLHPTGVSVVLGGSHYISNVDGSVELYNTDTDPLELNDLSDDPANSAVVDRMRALIEHRPAGR